MTNPNQENNRQANQSQEANHPIDINAWPAAEAKRILDNIGWKTPEKGFVLFETGYGPSGLPHIGTFGEVVRTSFVVHAFKLLAPQIPTKLLVVSDDFDGMRSVPDNVPQTEMLKGHKGKPLIDIPNPFNDECKTYGQHMNKRLCSFLDQFGFQYEFMSASKAYREGVFDKYLAIAAERNQQLLNIMLPTLGEQRQSTYSPFLPFEQSTGKLLTEGVESVDPQAQTIKYKNSEGKTVEQKFTSGGSKLQWKCDFGMRWAALDVDYEIYGKDHYPNEKTYQAICKALGGKGPVNYFYELFLDDEGNKISKSKGNGITVEDWTSYANIDALSFYMYQKPRTAKKLTIDVIAKTFDDYITALDQYRSTTDEKEKSKSPIFYVHRNGQIPSPVPVSFGLIINLVSAANAHREDVVWSFLEKYSPDLKKGSSQLLDQMVQSAIRYYVNLVLPQKKYDTPTPQEQKLLLLLKAKLEEMQSSEEVNAMEKQPLCQHIQNAVYAIARENNENQSQWFQMLYRTLLGTTNGPRMGSFVALYGISQTIALINDALKR